MKHAVVILSGAGDEPLAELGGRTPLAAASMPVASGLARGGRVGAAEHTPAGLEPSAGAGLLSLLGFDPRRLAGGGAALLARAAGVLVEDDDWVLLVDLVATGLPGTPLDRVLLGPCGETMTDAEGAALLRELAEFWAQHEPEWAAGLVLHALGGGRGLIVDRSGLDYEGVETADPHTLRGEPWALALPGGARMGAGRLRRLMELSAVFLPGHEVNAARAEQNLPPATLAWVWGAGRAPRLPSFESVFGVRGALIASDPAVLALGACLSLQHVSASPAKPAGSPAPPRGAHRRSPSARRAAGAVKESVAERTLPLHFAEAAAGGRTDPPGGPGAGAAGLAAAAALDEFDLVCCHVSSPGEASVRGDAMAKVAALRDADRDVIKPLAARLAEFGDPERDPDAEGWRLLVAVDLCAPVRLRRLAAGAAPFLLAGAWVRSLVARGFDEESAAGSDLVIDPGHTLMEYFLRGGLARVR